MTNVDAPAHSPVTRPNSHLTRPRSSPSIGRTATPTLPEPKTAQAGYGGMVFVDEDKHLSGWVIRERRDGRVRHLGIQAEGTDKKPRIEGALRIG